MPGLEIPGLEIDEEAEDVGVEGAGLALLVEDI
jgi:hypothetical protein